MAAAVALQSLDPEEFERQARRIVLDDDEDDQLRALSLNALAFFGDPAAQSEDDELARTVETLNSQSRSRLGEEGGRRLPGQARRLAAVDGRPGEHPPARPRHQRAGVRRPGRPREA